MTTDITRLLEGLHTRGGFREGDIANVMGVSPATVSHWAQGTESPDLRTRAVIADLWHVVERLCDLYTADETRLWLQSPHPLLGNARAIDLISQDHTEAVLAVIERLDAGAML